jgi:transposase
MLISQAGIPTVFAFHELLPSRTDTIGSDSTPCWPATGVASCRIESIALEITLDERCPSLGPWGVVGPDRVVGHYARQFEPSAQAIRNWVKQAALDAGERTDGLTTVERDELGRLRREVRQLREDRATLSKAAAWFARETNSIPSKDSSS